MPTTKTPARWEKEFALRCLLLAKGNSAAAVELAEESIFQISKRTWQWAEDKYQRLHTGSPS